MGLASARHQQRELGWLCIGKCFCDEGTCLINDHAVCYMAIPFISAKTTVQEASYSIGTKGTHRRLSQGDPCSLLAIEKWRKRRCCVLVLMDNPSFHLGTEHWARLP